MGKIKMAMRNHIGFLALSLCLTVIFSSFAAASYAKTKGEIDAGVKAAMNRFKKDIKGGTAYLKGAK